MTSEAQRRIASVTVTFDPDPVRLKAQLRGLTEQGVDVIVVDNGSATSPLEHLNDPALVGSVHWKVLPHNVGVAQGLNLGIAHAKQLGAEFVLCMDHDSFAPEGFVDALHTNLLMLEQCGKPVLAVGPCVSDNRDNRALPFIKLRWLLNKRQQCSEVSDDPIETDFLISSGCFSRISAYDQAEGAGPLDDELFIDSVDFEWCCRARAKGFELYGVCKAVLHHHLGDSRKTIAPGLSIVVHSPTRFYYMTRNRLNLYGRPYVPLSWKANDFLRMIAKSIITIIFIAPRRAYFGQMLRALNDARVGKLGTGKKNIL